MPESPRLVFLHPKGLHGNVVKALIQAIPEEIKGKGPRCTIQFQCPIESYSPYWSRTMRFSSFPQGLEIPHIQEDTMLMLGALSWKMLTLFWCQYLHEINELLFQTFLSFLNFANISKKGNKFQCKKKEWKNKKSEKWKCFQVFE